MKTIKFIGMMIAMLAMSVSFSSCSSDDDDPVVVEEKGFIGTWVHIEEAGTVTFVFTKNGTGSRMINLIDNNGNSTSVTEQFKYTYTETSTGKGTIQVHIEGSSNVNNWTYTLTGDTLMLNDGSGVWVLSRR